MPALDDSSAEDGSPLIPLIARVIELGRGPLALLKWVRDRLAVARRPDASTGGPVERTVAARLACELCELLAESSRSPGTRVETTPGPPCAGIATLP